MSTILVPIDFSEETPEVIECAAMLARRNRSQLVLMHVSAGNQDDEDDVAEKLERLERCLREDGLQVSWRSGRRTRKEIVEYGGSIKRLHHHRPA